MDTTPQLNKIPTPGSQEWEKQAGKYIRRYAPASKRIFIRDSKPGRTWMRYILPVFFVLLGMAMLFGGFYIKGDVDRVNGADGTMGSFVIEDLDSYVDKNGRETIRPIITLDDGSQVVAKGPVPQDATYAVGDFVDVYYVTSGTPVAFLPTSDGSAPNNDGFIVLVVMGVVMIIGGVCYAVLYRGQVEPQYFRVAMAELEAGRPLPQ